MCKWSNRNTGFLPDLWIFRLNLMELRFNLVCAQDSGIQLNAQPPAPEFGHEPHGLGGIRAASVEVPVVAKTDSNFSRFFEWQLGHSGTVLERTSASNS